MGIPSPDSSRKEEVATLRCIICDKPIAIENAKTDCDGNAFHGECYALKVSWRRRVQADTHMQLALRRYRSRSLSRARPQKVTELVVELK